MKSIAKTLVAATLALSALSALSITSLGQAKEITKAEYDAAINTANEVTARVFPRSSGFTYEGFESSLVVLDDYYGPDRRRQRSSTVGSVSSGASETIQIGKDFYCLKTVGSESKWTKEPRGCYPTLFAMAVIGRTEESYSVEPATLNDQELRLFKSVKKNVSADSRKRPLGAITKERCYDRETSNAATTKIEVRISEVYSFSGKLEPLQAPIK